MHRGGRGVARRRELRAQALLNPTLEEAEGRAQEAAKALRATAKALADASAILTSLNEKLESRLVTRLLAQYQKQHAELTGELVPECERLKKEIARVSAAFEKALAAKKREKDPGGAAELGRALTAFHARVQRLSDGELTSDPFEDFDALESKPLRRASEILARVAYEDVELGDFEEELAELGDALTENIEEARA